MRCINKVILIGNLTREPELRTTPSGQMVATFGLATNREWTTREGEKKSSAEFHECVAWGKLAEICSNFLQKGQLVYVEGYLKTRSWESQEGQKKFKTEIVIKDMIRLEKGQGKDSAAPEVFEDQHEEDYHTDLQETSNENEIIRAQDQVEETPSESAVDTSAQDDEPKSIIDQDLGL